jgi:hypothetical protein
MSEFLFREGGVPGVFFQLFLALVNVRFCRGFAEKRVQPVVFLW